MALRYEPTRDDNVQWSMISPRTSYPVSGETSHKLSMSQVLDLSFTAELSDHEDRRTSSCSPDSFELLGNEAHSPYSGVTRFRSPGIPSCQSDDNSRYLNQPGEIQAWSATSERIKENILCRNTASVKRPLCVHSRPYSAFTRPEKLGSAIHGEENDTNQTLFLSKIDRVSSRSPAYSYSPKNKEQKPFEQTINEKNAQNGGYRLPNDEIRTTYPRHVGPKKKRCTSPISTFVSEDVSSTRTSQVISKCSTADLSRSCQNQVKESQHLSELGRSEETDAAEALLGLSEGFYKTAAASKHVKVLATDSPKRNLDKSCVTSEQVSPTVVESISKETSKDTKMCKNNELLKNKTESSAEPKHSRFHFKKLFCQKFVNSLDRQESQNPSDSSSNNTATSRTTPRREFQNGESTVIKSLEENGSNVSTKSFQSQAPKSKAKPNSTKTQNKENVITDDASKFCDSSIRKTEDSQQIQQPSDKSPKQSVNQKRNSKSAVKSKRKECNKNKDEVSKLIISETSEECAKSTTSRQLQPQLPQNVTEKNNQSTPTEKKSNLYRVTSFLGSPSMSYASDDELDEDDIISSDSSSEYSSESDDDDDVESRDEVTNSSGTCKQANHVADETVKRKAFVLSKPKFSLPSKENNCPDKLTSVGNPAINKNGQKFGESDVLSLQARSSPNQNGKLSAKFSFSSDSNDFFKQSGIHIKKATFTFSSATKPENASLQNRLMMTSQCSVPVDLTRCASTDKNCFNFDKDKLLRNQPTAAKQKEVPDQTWTNSKGMTFGTFHKGDSFETLSKPQDNARRSKDAHKNAHKDTYKSKSMHKSKATTPLSYDKLRLPRPSARSAALEAQNNNKEKEGRKRKRSEPEEVNLKRKLRLSSKNSAKKRLTKGHVTALSACQSELHDVADSHTVKQHVEKKQNGDPPAVKSNISSGNLGISRSSSRRKPSCVFKHQKYTSVSMVSSNQSPRDPVVSKEFAIMRKPLNLDHRMMLANSIDPDRCSFDSSGTETGSVSLPSSSCSSRTSSVAGEEHEIEGFPRNGKNSPDNRKFKRHRHRSAAEISSKSDTFRRKQKAKRLMSASDQSPRCQTSVYAKFMRLSNCKGMGAMAPPDMYNSSFQLLSCFPAPASLRAGYAMGELLPGYGSSVSGQRSSLPLRWKKGRDISELKQKKQRDRWRGMTLDMFCMGAKS